MHRIGWIGLDGPQTPEDEQTKQATNKAGQQRHWDNTIASPVSQDSSTTIGPVYKHRLPQKMKQDNHLLAKIAASSASLSNSSPAAVTADEYVSQESISNPAPVNKQLPPKYEANVTMLFLIHAPVTKQENLTVSGSIRPWEKQESKKETSSGVVKIGRKFEKGGRGIHTLANFL